MNSCRWNMELSLYISCLKKECVSMWKPINGYANKWESKSRSKNQSPKKFIYWSGGVIIKEPTTHNRMSFFIAFIRHFVSAGMLSISVCVSGWESITFCKHSIVTAKKCFNTNFIWQSMCCLIFTCHCSISVCGSSPHIDPLIFASQQILLYIFFLGLQYEEKKMIFLCYFRST